jgi:hypothetical protein
LFYFFILAPAEKRSIKYQNLAKDEESLIGFWASLASNIRGTLKILSNNNINSNVIEKIRENVSYFTDNLMLPNFPFGEMEEIQEKAE